jgi:uncharacterized membrane protein SirB2
MKTLYRVAPAILLFFFAPLVAEFVLGDLGLAEIGAFIALAPLYGGGAILIREIVRRTGRSWPTFAFLGLGYAFLEEGILTQSLFNPNYLHLRLIDYGFVPFLGTGLPWALFVLTIHVVWSLAVPAAMVEAANPTRRTEPWLKSPGLVITTLLFLLGCFFVSRFSLGATDFRASALQLAASAALILASITLAFILFPRQSGPTKEGKPTNPWVVGLATFVTGSALQLANTMGKAHLPWIATVGLELAIIIATLMFFRWAARGGHWTALQNWAAAMGGLLCYVWVGYGVDRALHGPGHALDHTIFVLVALFVAAWAGMRAGAAA